LTPALQPVVVDREALDDGDPGDVDPALHGTRMAMEAGAIPGSPIVGAAPSAVRIVSIRATDAANELSFDAYKQAMLLCELRATSYNIRVISLSIGFQGTPTPEQTAQLEDAIADARNRFGIDVVAAAGNDSSPRISYPAAEPGVLAVGASNAQREPCSFSNTGAQLALLAPGCDLEAPNPLTGAIEYDEAGTSFSAVDVAAVLAALRAYRPDLDAEAAEQLMRHTATATGGVLDVGALFAAAGLGAVIAAGEANEPALTPPPATTTPQPHQPALRGKPRIQTLRRGKMLIVRLLDLPHGDRIAATLLGPRQNKHRRRLSRISTSRHAIRLAVVHGALLRLVYIDPAGRVISQQASVLLR
jgi:subtilisin family serine protease